MKIVTLGLAKTPWYYSYPLINVSLVDVAEDPLVIFEVQEHVASQSTASATQALRPTQFQRFPLYVYKDIPSIQAAVSNNLFELVARLEEAAAGTNPSETKIVYIGNSDADFSTRLNSGCLYTLPVGRFAENSREQRTWHAVLVSAKSTPSLVACKSILHGMLKVKCAHMPRIVSLHMCQWQTYSVILVQTSTCVSNELPLPILSNRMVYQLLCITRGILQEQDVFPFTIDRRTLKSTAADNQSVILRLPENISVFAGATLNQNVHDILILVKKECRKETWDAMGLPDTGDQNTPAGIGKSIENALVQLLKLEP